MQLPESIYKTVTCDEYGASENHVFKVVSDGSVFRVVVPAPLAEDFAMEFVDEISAWSWLAVVRCEHVSGKLWDIEGSGIGAKCLWKALGDIPVNDSNQTESVFLHFELGTDCHDIWRWFEEEFDVSVAIDLMNLKQVNFME